jgi:four helix bundle suffix protein
MSSTVSTASTYPEIAANAALTLIAVATALLDRQIAAQARTFESEGGFTERLYRTRSATRGTRRNPGQQEHRP